MIQASLHHAAAMAAIHAAAFPDEPWDAASFLALLGQPGVVGLIDAAGGMAMLRCVADEAEILTIGVSQRRQGLGWRLLQAACGEARARGVFWVFLEVAADNLPARALYARADFTEVGCRKNYYGNAQDALVLRKAI